MREPMLEMGWLEDVWEFGWTGCEFSDARIILSFERLCCSR